MERKNFATEIRNEVINVLDNNDPITEKGELFWVDDCCSDLSMNVDEIGKDEHGWFIQEDGEVWHINDLEDVGVLHDIYEGVCDLLNI